MENIRLAGKAHPPNKDIQWNLPVFSLRNMKSWLECKMFREFLSLASWLPSAAGSDIVFLIFSGHKRILTGVDRK